MGSPGRASEILVCASPPAPGAMGSGAAGDIDRGLHASETDTFEKFSSHLNDLRLMSPWPVYFLVQSGLMNGVSAARFDYL
eukprot:10930761-Heterocapsa_arctica.AAC.1